MRLGEGEFGLGPTDTVARRIPTAIIRHQFEKKKKRETVSTNPMADAGAELTDYERQRLELIARNRARLLQLGIKDAVEGLNALAPPPKKQREHAPRCVHGTCREPAVPAPPPSMEGACRCARCGAAPSMCPCST